MTDEAPAGVLVEIGLLLVVLGALGRLSVALRVSPIPLYLLLGLLLGTLREGPITFSPELVDVGAQFGVVLLLFMLGLEFGDRELVAGLRRTAPGGALDVLLNFSPGFFVGVALGWGALGGFVLGGVTYISSSGLVAKVLTDLGWRGHRETPSVVSLLVLEDLVMVAYLPVLAVLVADVPLDEAGLRLLAAAAFAACALAVGLRYGHVVTRALSPRSEEALLLTTFGFALVAGGLAEAVLASAAVGAFLAGVLVSGPVVERARGVLTPLRDLFAATFFVFFGLQIDLGAAADLLAVAVGLATLTGATKLVTGWWIARRAGVPAAGRLRAGSALIARGEFSIVIAGLAVAAGVEPDLGVVAGVYVLLTALAGTVLARAVGTPAGEIA